MVNEEICHIMGLELNIPHELCTSQKIRAFRPFCVKKSFGIQWVENAGSAWAERWMHVQSVLGTKMNEGQVQSAKNYREHVASHHLLHCLTHFWVELALAPRYCPRNVEAIPHLTADRLAGGANSGPGTESRGCVEGLELGRWTSWRLLTWNSAGTALR